MSIYVIFYDFALITDQVQHQRASGFGLTDGEGMERLWSFLRRFARVTKEMTPSHRLDLLTDALLHYGRRKSTDLG